MKKPAIIYPVAALLVLITLIGYLFHTNIIQTFNGGTDPGCPGLVWKEKTGPITQEPPPTTTAPGSFEFEVKNNYRIPNEQEIADAKKRQMDTSKFTMMAASCGEEEAERALEKELQNDIDYMIAANERGTTTLQGMCIGDDPGCLPLSE